MDIKRLNLRSVAIFVCLTATVIFASCKKETPDLNGTVTISPTANVFTGTELTAAYSGSEKITWQWNKSGTAIGGATNDKYTPTEAGSYTVTANAAGYNDKTSAAVEVKAIFLLEEKQRDGFRYVYEYDNQDRITKRTLYSVANEQLLFVYTYKYNAAGDLVEWVIEDPNRPTTPENRKITFTKSGDKITWSNYDTQYEVELNTIGLHAKCTWIYNRGGNDFEKETRKFTWQNGNLTQMDGIEEWKVGGEEGSEEWTETFTYDGRMSPFYHCKTPKWYLYIYEERYLSSVNNVKIMSWSWGIGSETYEYEYLNADGFPEKRTRVGSTNTETYKYKKK